MITFRKMTLWGKLLLLIPSYKRAHDKRLYQAIETLVKNPEMPCNIGGEIIPDGFGTLRANELLRRY